MITYDPSTCLTTFTIILASSLHTITQCPRLKLMSVDRHPFDLVQLPRSRTYNDYDDRSRLQLNTPVNLCIARRAAQRKANCP
ncbi:hypothetical protein DAEQUDRAFT_730216 [Daedalea quercina L-15889]|uniref:Uncharacterized protein n=1 Tax=Daedalea quercina L-15889 TaxID=1314783 RepID=A0A165N4M5_9APHY|nr:hypothetical protein DAEQUDRAFT_730216 [Daedalea quercina L-15889]